MLEFAGFAPTWRTAFYKCGTRFCICQRKALTSSTSISQLARLLRFLYHTCEVIFTSLERHRIMLARKYLFPHVIEMNYQACRRLGVNVYLIDGGSEFLLIDIGYMDSVDEIVELIRQMDFNLSTCKIVIATHVDADHIQGITLARELLRTKVAAHPLSVEPLESGDEIMTYATIKAQGIEIPMPRCKIDLTLQEGDTIKVGNVSL